MQEYSTDAHEERLRFQMARILDVNQHLAALVDSGDKPSFPLHMNLALLNINVNQNQNQSQEVSDEVKRLREQNVKLSSDLEKKQELVVQLEAEKTQLVRELFASKAQQQQQQQQQTQRYRNSGSGSADTTLM